MSNFEAKCRVIRSDASRFLERDNTTDAVVDEKAIVGLYRFTSHYCLFDLPEQYNYAQRFFSLTPKTPYPMATGKAYMVNGVHVAYQIILTVNGHPKTCWTTPYLLAPVKIK